MPITIKIGKNQADSAKSFKGADSIIFTKMLNKILSHPKSVVHFVVNCTFKKLL
jgi:hypothetical protein